MAAGQWELFTSVKIDDNNNINAPSNLSTSVSVNNVNLSWSDNANNESGYQVERSLSSSDGYSLIATLGANANSYSDNSLADGIYYYKVRAIGENNSVSSYSNIANAQVGELAGFDLHFKNTNNWNEVYVYLYNKATGATLSGWAWPGVSMSQESTSQWYKYSVNESVEVGIVFNNNNNGQQTDDLIRTTNGWFDFSNSTWYDSCPGDCPGEIVPVLSVSPAGGNYSNSVSVNLSATESGLIYYTTDGSTPDNNSTSYTAGINITSTTNLKAIAYNEAGNSNIIDEIYTITSTADFDIHFKNTSNWNDVYVYLYNKNTGAGISGWDWPGKAMSQELTSKWYSYTISESEEVGIVINNNNNGQQTDDLFRTINGWYDYSNSTWYDSCPGDCPGETPAGLTIYYNNNSTNWSSVNLYFWNTSPVSLSTSWPGVQMTDSDGDGWFEYTLEGVECANVIFSNNGNSQTGNLDICTEGWYDNAWVSKPSSFKSAKVFSEFIETNVYEIKPYPNPFNNQLNFRIAAKDKNVKIKILDTKGAVKYAKDMFTNDGEIKLSLQLSKGIYFMQVFFDNNVSTYKVIKH